jgi:hypothetical protein
VPEMQGKRGLFLHWDQNDREGRVFGAQMLAKPRSSGAFMGLFPFLPPDQAFII